MKTPGPDHPISLTPSAQHLRVRLDDHVIADSQAATMLQEDNYPPVAYFPRDGIEMALLTKTATSTHCPYKGDASYYSIFLDGRLVEDVAWSYEAPYPAMDAIKGLIAFYPNKVTVYPVSEADLEARTSPQGQGVDPAP